MTYEVAFLPAYPIVAKVPHEAPVRGARWISNWFSFVTPSVQLKVIVERVAEDAERLVGSPAIGAAATLHISISEATFSRPPVTVFPESELVGVADAVIAERSSWALIDASCAEQRAIAPLTCGVAIEVPLYAS